MREMMYKPYRIEALILYEDTFKGFDYKIVSYGTHPCAYIKIPQGHQIYKVDYSKLDIPCHGGLTYSCFEKDGNWWIGWDYAHVGDYTGFDEIITPADFSNKKWSIKEIYEEILKVINETLIQKNIRIYEDD